MREFVFDHERLRTEFDWVAVDLASTIGYFATAGEGPVPSGVAAHCELYDGVLETVLTLPVLGSADMSATPDRDVGEWLEVARRGFFAYDWRMSRSCYELVARPSVPATLNVLSNTALAELTSRTRLNVVFAAAGHCINLT